MITKILLSLLFLLSISCGFPLKPGNRLTTAPSESYFIQDHMGPGTYAFGYDIEDPSTGNVQFRQEERYFNGTVTGSYGYVNAEGKTFVVTYVSDEKGYRATIEKQGESRLNFPNQNELSRWNRI